MKNLLKAIKDNIKYLIFWSLFGSSVGYNIKQYYKLEKLEKYNSDLFYAYMTCVDANATTFDGFSMAVQELKNNNVIVSKEFKLHSDTVIISTEKFIKSFDKMDSVYFSK